MIVIHYHPIFEWFRTVSNRGRRVTDITQSLNGSVPYIPTITPRDGLWQFVSEVPHQQNSYRRKTDTEYPDIGPESL